MLQERLHASEALCSRLESGHQAAVGQVQQLQERLHQVEGPGGVAARAQQLEQLILQVGLVQ